jgi:predicted hydrolase (HD superfamily)
MEITIDRMKHSLAVAKKMKELVSTDPQKNMCSPEDAFVLGLLHDIGYEFSSEQKEHANNGGLLLKEQGYKYWKEVYYHGIPQDEYDSPLLRLLNYVDMITGPTGEYVTVEQRIEDIAERYGEGSWQTEEAQKLATKILKYEE